MLVLNKAGQNRDDSLYFLGAGYLSDGADLEAKPKYIAVIGLSYFDGFGEKINRGIEYERKDYTEEWNKHVEKYEVTKTAIYRWDSTQNKYMFESVDTLEDWLKEHPIETL